MTGRTRLWQAVAWFVLVTTIVWTAYVTQSTYWEVLANKERIEKNERKFKGLEQKVKEVVP